VTLLSASNRLQLALANSKALAFYDRDVGVMSEPVKQSGDAGGVWEDIVPVLEWLFNAESYVERRILVTDDN
jgi:hypothetical protein